MKNKVTINENTVKTFIKDNPRVLGLSNDLEFYERQKRQQTGKILDVILKNSDDTCRYIVEIMLGDIDESHIIRLIGYWDIEKRANPLRKYKAVLVAENTSKFLNIIHAIQYSVPITLIQMVATEKENGQVGLFFTKVFDSITQENYEQSKTLSEPASPESWTAKCPKTMPMVKDIFLILEELERENAWNVKFELNYTKPYIGIKINGIPNNFINFIPCENKVNFCSTRYRSKELPQKCFEILESPEHTLPSYNSCGIELKHSHMEDENNRKALKEIIKIAFDDK